MGNRQFLTLFLTAAVIFIALLAFMPFRLGI
jgi:hypothetical protein